MESSPSAEVAGSVWWIDDVPLRAIQIRIFLLCGLVTILDGLDTQSIGLVAPLMAKDLGFNKTMMGWIFSVAQAGATLGALAFGPLADRFGRKSVTLLGVSIVALFTWATAVATSFAPLLLIRFIAGVGLAGTIPSVLALTSEYAPHRLRGTLVAAVFAGYPTGAALGGLLAASILKSYDWQWVFYLGALLPLLTLALITIWLPESVRYLMDQPASVEKVEYVLSKFAVARTAIPAVRGCDAVPMRSILSVFASGLALPTLLLCLIYFFVFATTKIMVVWLPTVLTDAGVSVSYAAIAQATFNLGCVVGMLSAGWLVDRFGVLRALVPALLLVALSVIGLGLAGGFFPVIVLMATLVGIFIGVGGAGAHAIAARLYPVDMRSTGLGWGSSASRLGQVLSPLLAALLLADGLSAIRLFSGLALFPVLAGLCAIAFALIRGPEWPTTAATGPR